MTRLQFRLGTLLLCASLPCLVQAAISPTKLEVNIGPLPVDVYCYGSACLESQYNVFPGVNSATCTAGSVRTCMASVILPNYAYQGVTGARFMFALAGGQWTLDGGQTYKNSYSTPFDSNGNISSAWLAHLYSFFTDLSSAGITSVTPTSIMATYWSGYNTDESKNVLQSATASYLNNGGCPTGTKTLYFFPWLPFGLNPYDGPGYPYMYVDGRTDGSGTPLARIPKNQAYDCAPANPNFWGWSKFFNLVDQVAAQAAAAGINIEEWDIEQELNLAEFTVEARLIYDNTTNPPTPVLQNVRQILANRGFSAGAATYSVGAARPNSAAFDCGSVYGDSAHLLMYSEMMAATGGAMIGQPPFVDFNGEMECDGSLDPPPAQDCYGLSGTAWQACATADMTPVPAQAVLTTTDIHMTPCVLGTSGCSNTGATSTAVNMFSDAWFLLNWRQLTGNLMMFGETYSNAPTTSCNGDTQTMTQQGVSGYLSSTLYSSDGSNVVLRPWEWVMATTCETPANIGAPAGPFTP